MHFIYERLTQLFYTNSTPRKWNESGFRPPLCTYRLNWARRTSWGWWDDWDDTVLQTQDSKFEPWRSEAELATSRSRRLPTILTFTRGWGRNIFFVSFKPPRPGTEPRTLAWKAAVLTTTLGPPPSTPRNNMVCMPNSLSGTKSLKNALAFWKMRIIYRECRFYIFNYIFLFYLAVYVLKHLNYVKCPCLSFLRIFFFWGGGRINWIFLQKIRVFSSRMSFTYLAIYYNLIMQFMSCDTYAMLNIHVS